MEIQPGQTILVPTGVQIESVTVPTDMVDEFLPELQIRSRSSIAMQGLIIPNGIGTIDADYREEIMVPLMNLSSELLRIKAGTRIAQLTQAITIRMDLLVRNKERKGGFGSTGEE
jgi:dUTP pyrophosphatase